MNRNEVITPIQIPTIQEEYRLISNRIEEESASEEFDDFEDDLESDSDIFHETFVRPEPKIGRNDPCPCGSGKKYKKCHGD
jgi:preprotein translocase subunit SecA